MFSNVTASAGLWPMALYFLGVLGVTIGMLAASWVLGERHKERATGEPYESGIVSTGSARVRFSSNFYLIGMLFVVFDLESVFIYAWAVAVRELGWLGYIEMLVFVGVLLAAFVYLWREGAFDIRTRSGKTSRT